MSDYIPPTDLWGVDENLQFNEALDKDDKRYVPTAQARGDYSLTRLFRSLGVDDRDPAQLWLRTPRPRSYTLFCGHRGCGKSTELRRIADRLHNDQTFFVIFLDVLSELDYNNLQYADIFLALGKALFEQLENVGIDLDDGLLFKLKEWFSDKVETNTHTRELAAELKTGVKAETGIPYLAKLFVGMTTAVKDGSSYKQELRTIVENTFSEFSKAFNLCIHAAEAQLQKKGFGKKVLFIVDGTDRLRGKDSERFFIQDVNQLKQIEANVMYCAPIHLVHDNAQVRNDFDVFMLPMIKIHEKGSDEPIAQGYAALEQMIYKRADKSLFSADSVVDKLIQYSGGSPRELLKLLHYAFLRAAGDQFDDNAVDAAIHDLATDYKRIIDSNDYKLLVDIDCRTDVELNSKEIQNLLYNLIVLEYNGFWRQTHPVVQTLQGYQQYVSAKS